MCLLVFMFKKQSKQSQTQTDKLVNGATVVLKSLLINTQTLPPSFRFAAETHADLKTARSTACLAYCGYLKNTTNSFPFIFKDIFVHITLVLENISIQRRTQTSMPGQQVAIQFASTKTQSNCGHVQSKLWLHRHTHKGFENLHLKGRF